MPNFGYTNVDPNDGSITLMAAGAFGDLTGEGWSFYNSTDAPEGAWNYYGNAAITATIALPVSLSAGTWYIFFKFIDYDVHRNVYVTLGSDTSDTVATDYRNVDGQWNGRMTLVVVTPGSSLIFHFSTGVADASHMFRGIFLTRDVNATLLSTDIIVNLNYPVVMDDSTAVKGNLFPNGSFETGVGFEWGIPAQGSGRTVAVQTMWDNSQGWEGAACLKYVCDSATRLNPSNTSESIVSRVFHFSKPNHTYTASAYIKTSAGLSTTATIRMVNTFVPPAGYTGQHSISSSPVSVTSAGWTRISVTGYLLAYPTCDYNMYIDFAGCPDGSYVLVDGVQLEEGTLAAWAAAATVEASININQTAKPGYVYYHSDTLQATLVARNNTAGSLTKTFRFQIIDYMNRIVREGSQSLTIAANTTYTSATFDISTGGKLGVFRLVSWIEGLLHTEREIVYSIIPAVPAGVDTTSYLGTHPNFYAYQLNALARLGMKWGRDLSPQAIGRWSTAETADNTFVFQDARVTAIDATDLTPMITLGYLWPSWADSSGLPNVAKFAEFCTQMVAHYSPNVKYWEIWNENEGITDARSAQLIKEGTDAIHTQDATAKVIAMGGLNATRMNAVIAELESQYPTWNWETKVDFVSTHDYVGGTAPEDMTTIINTWGVPMWNTESGVWDNGSYGGPSCNFKVWGRSIWPHQDALRFYRAAIRSTGEIVKNFVRTIGAGQTKFFYYDSRYYAEPAFFDEHTSLLEYDGSIRSKGVAYAIAGQLIDHATTLGNVSTDANSHMWVFNTSGNPIACLFTTDFAPRQITVSLSLSQFEVLDMMGNVISSTTAIKYGRIPVWVRGLSISAATLSGALSGGTVATRSDLDAPFLSIQDGPRGTLPSGMPFRMRWVAIDDTSYPNLGEINIETSGPADIANPEAILYKYRLVPYSDWSAWTAYAYIDYSGLADRVYTFEVQAKDVAGNLSAISSRTVQVGQIRRLLLRSPA